MDFVGRGGEAIDFSAYSFNSAAVGLMTKLGLDQEVGAVFAELELSRLPQRESLRTDLVIRSPDLSEAALYIQVFDECSPFAFERTPSMEDISRWLSCDNSAEILVGEYDGQVIGLMEYFRDGVIGIPGILPTYRRQGFGETLFYNLLSRGHCPVLS